MAIPLVIAGIIVIGMLIGTRWISKTDIGSSYVDGTYVPPVDDGPGFFDKLEDKLGLGAALSAIIDQWIIDIFSSTVFQIVMIVVVVWVVYKLYKVFFGGKK